MATEVKQLYDTSSIITLFGIEICFFQHHRIAWTIKHLETFGLPCTIETIAKVYFSLTAFTTTSRDFNDTVRTSCTPFCSRSSVFQNSDAGNVIRVHLQECRKLFLVVKIIEVQRRSILSFKRITIDNNQRFLRTIDGTHTTKAHRCSRSQVTRVGNNVQTCDFPLQSFTCSGERQALLAIHIECLRRRRHFFGRNLQTIRVYTTLAHNIHLREGIAVMQFDSKRSTSTNSLKTSCLIADVRNFKSVIRVLNRHGEVTVRVGLCLRDHTVAFILLHDVSHNDGTICLAKHVTRNTLLLRKGRRCATQSKYNRRSILYVVHNG